MTRRFENHNGIIIDNKTTIHYITSLDWEINLIVRLLNELSEQNRELQRENMEYHKLVSCSNCRYQNYDWFDDGDEFEVCDKGNNERQMYNRFCKGWEEV
jgi:hypothetical protein